MTDAKSVAPRATIRIFEGNLHRARRGQLVGGSPTALPEPLRRPARVAVMLALAHKLQQAIDRGALRDRAQVAARLGLTRSRVTQLLDLILLAPDIQDQILFAESVNGVEPLSERQLRRLVRDDFWPAQRAHRTPRVSR